jgi:hypothetical protein
MAVTLYRQVGKSKARCYQKINLGRGRRPADLTGPYFLRYSLADGTRPWEPVGDDLDEAIAARERRQLSLGVTLAYLKGKDAESEEARNMRTAAAWLCTRSHVESVA